MKAKLLKSLLTIACLLCSIVVYAEDFEVDGIYYIKNNETVEVTFRGSKYNSYNNEYTGSIVIPEKVTYNYTTYSVTSIGESAFEGCTGLTEVTIPNSVTSIGKNAFRDCTGLTEVTIPNSVTSIGVDAFYKCTGLTTVNFNAENCTTMEYSWSSIFQGCSNITAVNIGESVKRIPNYAFEYCTGLTEITIPNSVTSIGESAFGGCTGLTEVTIPNSVTWIGESAFKGCTSLTTVNFNAENCTSMGTSNYQVFTNCSKLTTLNIGESVKRIPNYAFEDCTGLTEVTIPESVTSIGYDAFSGCKGLRVYCLPIVPPSISSSTFESSAIINLSLELLSKYVEADIWKTLKLRGVNNGITYYPISATTLEVVAGDTPYSGEVIIPESITHTEGVYTITSIGGSAFSGCTGLTEVTIGNSVASIGNYAFRDCTGLTEITIPNSVTSIGKSAFYKCTELTSATIGNSVTSIGDGAFLGCSSLKSLTIEDGDSELELGYNDSNEGLFYDCPIETLYLGRNLSYNTSYSYYGYSPFYNKKELKTVTIGNSVTSIGVYAFEKCTGLTSITIPKSVTEIGDEAFDDCSGLKSLTIEDGDATLELGRGHDDYYGLFYDCPIEILYIGRNLSYNTSHGYSPFYNKKELKTVTIGNSVTSIGDKAFEDCTGLKSLTIEDGDSELKLGYNDSNEGLFYDCPIEILYIGRNLSYNTSHGYSPFYNKKELKTVTIGNSVTSIGEHAFYNCTGLTEVTIPNSVTSIGDYAFSGCTGLTGVYITDLSAWCGIDFGDDFANPLYYAHHLYINNELVTSLVIPDDVTSISGYAFYECTGLTEVTIPNSVTSIGSSAFYGCTGLTEVTIPNSVTSIGGSAFSGCESLRTVTIGSAVTEIGEKAFDGCDRIKTVNSYAEVPPTIYSNTFTVYVNDNATLNVVKGCKEAYADAKYWEYFLNVTDDLTAGVEDITCDNIDIPTEYYDLSGRRVENLTRGIYIVKHGDIVRKVFVNKAR